MKRYRRIAVPIQVTQQIERLMPVLGYRSLAEFIVEAVRRHLQFKEMEFDRRLREIAKEEDKGFEMS